MHLQNSVIQAVWLINNYAALLGVTVLVYEYIYVAVYILFECTFILL